MKEKDVKRILASIGDLAEECNRMSGRIDRLWNEIVEELHNKDKTKRS